MGHVQERAGRSGDVDSSAEPGQIQVSAEGEIYIKSTTFAWAFLPEGQSGDEGEVKFCAAHGVGNGEQKDLKGHLSVVPLIHS